MATPTKKSAVSILTTAAIAQRTIDKIPRDVVVSEEQLQQVVTNTVVATIKKGVK